MPDIRLRDITKSYDGRTDAVSHLDLTIADGEFMCLLGPSGCGKTTTLRMIAGLENLTDGEIAVGDRVVDSTRAGVFVPPEQRGMGLVFQSYALWPHLTIEQNTDFGLRLRRTPKAEREARVTKVMQALGIEQYRDRYPSQLSGGQQQRVALARMLTVNPDVLLLDEPLSNLDARLRLEMRAELKRIHEEFGTTIVFVTHDQWEAMTLATSIAVMHDGALQQVGRPDEIYDRPANRFVAEFVGNPPINVIEMQGAPGSELARAAAAFVARNGQSDAVASIGLRPEAIELVADGEHVMDSEDLVGTARISAVLPTGGSWIVEIDAIGAPLFMSTNRLPVARVGDETRFRVARADVHQFSESGTRLPPTNVPEAAKDGDREATRRVVS